MHDVPLAQLNTVEGGTRGLGLDSRGDDRAHRSTLVDQLDNDTDIADQLGGQDLHARLHQLLTHLEGVRAGAQWRGRRRRDAHGRRGAQGREPTAGPRTRGIGVHRSPALGNVGDVHWQDQSNRVRRNEATRHGLSFPCVPRYHPGSHGLVTENCRAPTAR